MPWQSFRRDHGERDRAAAVPGFWFFHAEPGGRFLQARADLNDTLRQIDRAPHQSAQLAPAHPGSERHLDNRGQPMPGELGANLGDLLRVQYLDFSLIDPRRLDDVHDVARDRAIFDRALETRLQDPVSVTDGARRQPAVQQRLVPAFDLIRPERLHGDLTEMRIDLQSGKLLVTL